MSINTEVGFCPYREPCPKCRERYECFTTVRKGQAYLLEQSKAKIAYNENYAQVSFANLPQFMTYYEESIEAVKLARMQFLRIYTNKYYIKDIRYDIEERRTIYRYRRVNPRIKVSSVSSLDRISACHAEETSSILVQSAIKEEYKEVWLNDMPL